MDMHDLADDSDTSDEDYTPDSKPEEVVSEVESDGDPEDQLSETEDQSVNSKRRKRKQPTTKVNARKKKPATSGADDDNANEHVVATTPNGEDEKKKEDDDLWADFIKDTDFRPKGSKTTTLVTNKSNTVKTTTTNKSDNNKTSTVTSNKVPEKVKITEIFEFAGEEIKIEKEVDANSAQARLSSSTSDNTKNNKRTSSGGSLSGIGSVLNQLGKKQKISTLEKTKLDWDRFKKEENIEEELQTHNKGKDGYLERQDFLQRADLRRFEIEKDIRSVERSKRLNN